MIELTEISDKGEVRAAVIEMQDIMSMVREEVRKSLEISAEVLKISEVLQSDYERLSQEFTDYLDQVTSEPETLKYDHVELPQEINEWSPMNDGEKCWLQKTKSGVYTIPTSQVPREVIEKHNSKSCSPSESLSEPEPSI